MTEDELLGAVASTLASFTGMTGQSDAKDLRADAVRLVELVRSVPSRRHAGPCVHLLDSSSESPTFLYLRDGTKVVMARGSRGLCLKVVPQAVILSQDLPDDS